MSLSDQTIVRAAIHPGIGVARVGNDESAFFIGPEVTSPPVEAPNFYRTSQGTLKRQAARFRIYGYNAAGDVVAELTASNAQIGWQVHLANRKSDWFHFITAMDIPESADLVVTRRNPDISSHEREQLIIDPGPRRISGADCKGPSYAFNSGKFKATNVYLGELQTDAQGRLLVLGGYGKSESPSGKPPFDRANPDSFNNAADWYDDIADGPVHATVTLDGKDIPVESAWVITAPPNYAPDLVSWRTMNDLLIDVYTQNGWLPVPETTSFRHHVLPQLQRLSTLQWVNKGFAALFGKGCPMDFNDPAFIEKLSHLPPEPSLDAYKQLRHQILNSFRPFHPATNEPRLWPFIYGDNYGGDLFQASPNTMLALPSLQQMHLQRWASGNFINDWNTHCLPPQELEDVPLAEQPAMLDQAAMHFCLADAFHPGCELTWPMRHPSLYCKPYRIRENTQGEKTSQWGKTLNQSQVMATDGPLYAQVAGGLTRWMGIPWQGDTAFCRSGYEVEYDIYLPTFWPARVPNTVLTEHDYHIVMDTNRTREERIAAYHRRASWNRFIDTAGKTADVMEKMIAHFAQQGIVEARKGISNDPDFPEVMYVENTTFAETPHLLKAALDTSQLTERGAKAVEAGWHSEEQLDNALRLRQRQKVDE